MELVIFIERILKFITFIGFIIKVAIFFPFLPVSMIAFTAINDLFILFDLYFQAKVLLILNQVHRLVMLRINLNQYLQPF